MKKNEETLSNLFLFRNLSQKEISALLNSTELDIREYKKNDIIFSPDVFEQNIGFVLKGRCYVRRSKHDGTDVLLNVLEQYDSFGVLATFSCDDFPTEISASTASKILFFKKEQLLSFMEQNSTVSINIIEFLTNRINFLNKRIATFTCTTAEEKLASFLLSEYAKYGSAFPFNCQKTATLINTGRASVYRALEALANSGYITYDTKKIIINDPKGLERTQK